MVGDDVEEDIYFKTRMIIDILFSQKEMKTGLRRWQL